MSAGLTMVGLMIAAAYLAIIIFLAVGAWKTSCITLSEEKSEIIRRVLK